MGGEDACAARTPATRSCSCGDRPRCFRGGCLSRKSLKRHRTSHLLAQYRGWPCHCSLIRPTGQSAGQVTSAKQSGTVWELANGLPATAERGVTGRGIGKWRGLGLCQAQLEPRLPRPRRPGLPAPQGPPAPIPMADEPPSALGRAPPPQLPLPP